MQPLSSARPSSCSAWKESAPACPPIGTTTVVLTFTATSKESVRAVVHQIKHDCLELYSYELKDRRTSQGEIFEASLEMKVRRGKHTERLMEYMDEFDDVMISSIE